MTLTLAGNTGMGFSNLVYLEKFVSKKEINLRVEKLKMLFFFLTLHMPDSPAIAPLGIYLRQKKASVHTKAFTWTLISALPNVNNPMSLSV